MFMEQPLSARHTDGQDKRRRCSPGAYRLVACVRVCVCVCVCACVCVCGAEAETEAQAQTS